MTKAIRLISALAASAALGTAALAQTTAQPPAPPAAPVHHGLLGRHPHSAGSQTPIAGGIIGNKKTHAYHLPGEKGSLPSEKNRVYFHTEAEAQAAGYHRAGQHKAGKTSGHPRTVKHSLRHPRGSASPPPANATPPTR